MKIIEPSSISGKIIDLIDTAKKELIIVSPYNEITGWKKLIKKIEKAQANGVNIIWYSRSNVKEKYPDEVRKLFKIKPILIDNLHAKIYMNERVAVITSMNLLETSDISSIDIGMVTENQKEYDEVLNFYDTYINKSILSYNQKPIQEVEKQSELPVAKVENKIMDISDLIYLNGIHHYVIKKYGYCNVNLGGKNIFGYPAKHNLKYSDFIRRGYTLYFEPYENAIKIYFQVPQTEIIWITERSNLKKYRSKLSSYNELEISFKERFIKYYYESHSRIISWDEKKLHFFLKDLDILIEIVYSESWWGK
jgi:hypothetical protein